MKPEISFEDFSKVDIRTGTVLNAESVPKSKLLKLEVDFGPLGIKQVLAGISKSYSPEGIKGSRIVAVVNLAPREMKGLLSEAMLFAGEISTGEIKLVEWNDIENGVEIG